MSVGREAWAHLGGGRGKCFQNTLYEKNAFSKELKKVILRELVGLKIPSLSRYQI